VLAEIYYNNQKKINNAKNVLFSAFTIGREKPEKLPLILATVDKEGIKKMVN